MRKLLTLIITLVFAGIAISPALAQEDVQMPDLEGQYVEEGVLGVDSCGDQQIVVEGYALKQGASEYIYDAITFTVNGQDSPYLVVIFSGYSPDNEGATVIVLYIDLDGGEYADQVITSTAGEITGSPCDFIPAN